MKNETQSHSSYIASTGKKAAERLALQHKVFKPGTDILLTMSNFQPEMRVLVIGSGGGDETCMIAKKLTGSGHVIALDKSEEQTKKTQQAVNKAGLTSRVSCVTKAVESLTPEDGKFDLILCRFILPHLHNLSQTIGMLTTHLEDNGILASQEPIVSECWSTPDSPALTQYLNLMLAFAAKKGLDFDMAKHIPNLFRQHGLITATDTWQPVVQGPDKYMLTMAVEECMPAIIQEKLITQAEADQLIEALNQEVVESDAKLYQCNNVLTVGAYNADKDY